MRKGLAKVAGVVILTSCAGQLPPPAASAPATVSQAQPVAAPPKPELIGADSPRATPGGIAYIAPAGWTLSASGALTILTAQEGDAHVALVDASAADAAGALNEAWKLYRAAPAPPVEHELDPPAREGWDQIRMVDYRLSPNEKSSAQAFALRYGRAWSVVLIVGANATLAKRSGQLGLLSAIRPKSYERESFKGKQANELDAARLSKLDGLIEQARQAYGVPGIAIAIVQGGKLIAAKGYGVRELGRSEPVDADTLFLIASNTKALSTLLLAELVDEGKLKWEQPVVEVYPDFKLGDAATTASTRIEHLVCACTGLPRQDMDWLFEFAGKTPLGMMASLAGVQPTTKFGETFQYSNQLAAAAGYAAAHVISPKLELGKAYDAAMKARIFDPLGMKTTTFDFQRALAANHATPHSWDIDGKTRNTPMDLNYSAIPIRPAAGAWSSANELIQYVRLELARGVAPSGRRLVSEQNILRRRQKSVSLGEDAYYGMGLAVSERYSVPLIEHGGGLIGMKSNMMWLPEHDVGAVFLSNSDEGGAVQDVFQRYLLELLFDAKPEALEDLATRAKLMRETFAKNRARLVVPIAPDARAGLAPRYVHETLGALTVNVQGDDVMFDFGEWRSLVASRKNPDSTTSVITISPGTNRFEFVQGKASDGKRQLTLRDDQHEYPFVEAPR